MKLLTILIATCFFSCRDFSQITNMKEIFAVGWRDDDEGSRAVSSDIDDPDRNFQNFDADVSKWDMSRVITMRGCFQESSFNADISEWDLSNCLSLYATFKKSKKFNRDISKWKFHKPVTMLEMFRQADGFKQGIWCSVEWIESPVSASLLGVMENGAGTQGNAAFCCAAGSYLGGTGSTNYSFNALASVNDCTKCPTGSFTDKLNIDRACTLCPKGWHIDVEGRSFCLPCERKCGHFLWSFFFVKIPRLFITHKYFITHFYVFSLTLHLL
jgi:hypothetical protein